MQTFRRKQHFQEEFLFRKGGQAWAGAAQGGDGAPSPGGVQGMIARGTQCSGLGENVGMRHSLDSMISEVFSTLNDSVVSAPGTLMSLQDISAVSLARRTR